MAMNGKQFEYVVKSGKLRHDGKLYRAGARFRTSVCVPKAFADCVEDATLAPVVDSETREPKPKLPKFRIQAKGGGWYDVIRDEDGKKMNDKSLQGEEDARALIDALGGKEA